MSVNTIYGAIAGAVLLFIFASVWAGRRGRLFLHDLGAVIVAPVVFFVIGGIRNLAWAGIIWPIVAGTVLMFAFAAKVFLVDPRSQHANRNSKWFFYSALIVSVATAVTVRPWYE